MDAIMYFGFMGAIAVGLLLFVDDPYRK